MTAAARHEYRKQHANLATAPTYKEFEQRVNDTDDTEVLSNLLDNQDDEGFEEATPRLTAPMRLLVRVRLADLGILTTTDTAHSPFFLLHHRLGHGGMLETCRVAKDLGIKLPRVEQRWCDACIRAGLTRSPRVKELRDRAALGTYEKVFTDIAGPFPIKSAYNSYMYIIGFIDAKTHEGTIYGMHTLDDVKACTEKFLSWVRTQRVTGQVEVTPVGGVFDPIGYTTLQTDSHSVYRSEAFKALVQSRFGAKLQHSPPYAQDKNGLIERFWRTIGCRARAMLFARELPANYWFWAYQHAARCHSLIGTSSNEGRKSPYEMKTGLKPTDKLKQLRSFGDECYVWEPNPGKLGAHGRKGVWIGWDDTNISNTIYFPRTGTTPQSIRQSTHIAMRNTKLPDAVLKGQLGMVFPEYTPLSVFDDLGVEITTQGPEVNNGGVQHTPTAAKCPGGTATTPRSTDQDLGVLAPRNKTMAHDGGVVEPRHTTAPSNKAMAHDGGVVGSKHTTANRGGVAGSNPATAADDSVVDMELSEISSDEDDMLMSNDDEEVITTETGNGFNYSEEETIYTMQETMDTLERPKRLTTKPARFGGTGRRKQRAPTSEIVVGDIKRTLPKRKPVTVGDITVSTARRIVCHAQLEHVISPAEEFPIGKLFFDCRKALNSKEYGEGFKASIKKELTAIDKFDVMKPVFRNSIPHDTKVFNSYMLCHRKSLGHPDWKCKSRLVVDGSNATPGIHTAEMDISTSLPRWNAVRLLISAAKGKAWVVKTGDVSTAFLRGEGSGKTIYMRMPQGLREYKTAPDGTKQEVLMSVHGNLYGKCDAPRQFELALWHFYQEAGFTQDPHEKSLWVRGLGTKYAVMVAMFCDDIIVAACNETAHKRFDAEVTARWGDCSIQEPIYILGCDVTQTATSIRLSASSKIRELLNDKLFKDLKIRTTPFPPGTVIDIRDCPAPDKKITLPFRSMLGKLQYIQYACRPTIAYNVSQLARVQNNPSMEHWKRLVDVVRYLKHTVDAGVEYRTQPQETRNRLVAYSDSSWADIPGGIGNAAVVDGRKSTLGHVLVMNGGPVAWKAHVSTIVALSSAEAELFATVACGKDICEARRLLEHVGEMQAPTPTNLWCDSSSVVSINSKRNTSSKLRHLEIKWFYCRYLAEAGVLATLKIDGDENMSDLLTKALGEVKFRKFAMMLETGQNCGWTGQVMRAAARAITGWSF